MQQRQKRHSMQHGVSVHITRIANYPIRQASVERCGFGSRMKLRMLDRNLVTPHLAPQRILLNTNSGVTTRFCSLIRHTRRRPVGITSHLWLPLHRPDLLIIFSRSLAFETIRDPKTRSARTEDVTALSSLPYEALRRRGLTRKR